MKPVGRYSTKQTSASKVCFSEEILTSNNVRLSSTSISFLFKLSLLMGCMDKVKGPKPPKIGEGFSNIANRGKDVD